MISSTFNHWLSAFGTAISHLSFFDALNLIMFVIVIAPSTRLLLRAARRGWNVAKTWRLPIWQGHPYRASTMLMLKSWSCLLLLISVGALGGFESGDRASMAFKCFGLFGLTTAALALIFLFASVVRVQKDSFHDLLAHRGIEMLPGDKVLVVGGRTSCAFPTTALMEKIFANDVAGVKTKVTIYRNREHLDVYANPQVSEIRAPAAFSAG